MGGSPQNHQFPISLPKDLRSVADLVQLAQMLAVARIDPGGNVVPLRMNELAAAWDNLHRKYPEQFKTDPEETFLWHKTEALDALVHNDPFAARFHLDQALHKRSNDTICLAERRAIGDTNMSGVSSALALNRSIPPRDPNATSAQVNLSKFYNLSLRQSLGQRPDRNNFASLPCGLQTFGGITYDLRGLIHLRGQRMEAEGIHYPNSAEGIPLNRKCRLLHFLQATSWDAGSNEEVGTYILHYADGQTAKLPIVFGKDIGNWWFWGLPPMPIAPGNALIAWAGYNPEAADSNASICLYKATFSNPRPDVEIQSIDFISAFSRAAPFLAAITAE